MPGPRTAPERGGRDIADAAAYDATKPREQQSFVDTEIDISCKSDAGVSFGPAVVCHDDRFRSVRQRAEPESFDAHATNANWRRCHSKRRALEALAAREGPT
jgi:hypothetical protein